MTEEISGAITGAIPPWRPLLRAAMQREGRSVAARWVQLATTGRDGAPRVRTLVFRGWAGADQLELFSDQRSCLLYTSPSPRDLSTSRMPSSA